MKLNKKLRKSHIIAIITTAAACLVAVAIIITNIFIPVKYLSAYINFSKDKLSAGELRVTFIDVGYGDSTLIELPDGKTALIDAGNGRRSNQLKILKILNKRNIGKIDYLIASSVSAERCGGLADILKYKDVGKIFMQNCRFTRLNDGYRAFCEQIKRFSSANSGGSAVETAYCGYGEITFSEDCTLCFLSPSNSGAEYDALNQNPTRENIDNASAVIWLEFKGTGFLMLGDITGAQADKLYLDYKLNDCFDINGRKIGLDLCRIVKVGNHGDKTAASPLFYDLIKPQAAIISVGKNGEGNPSAETLAEVEKHVSGKIYTTEECGTLTVRVGAEITVEKEKK